MRFIAVPLRYSARGLKRSPNAHPHASKRSPRSGERRKSIYYILCIRPRRRKAVARLCTADAAGRASRAYRRFIIGRVNFSRFALRANSRYPSAFRSIIPNATPRLSREFKTRGQNHAEHERGSISFGVPRNPRKGRKIRAVHAVYDFRCKAECVSS